MDWKVVFLRCPVFTAILAAIDAAIRRDHERPRVCARRDASHFDSRDRQRTPDGMPTGAEIVGDHDPAAYRRPDALWPRRIGRDRVDWRIRTAQAGVVPAAPPILAVHH